MDTCPHCSADLTGAPIPPESLKYYASHTHFSRKIGIQIQGVYDGSLFWMCPDCEGTWHRWPGGTYQHERAIPYIHGPR